MCRTAMRRVHRRTGPGAAKFPARSRADNDLRRKGRVRRTDKVVRVRRRSRPRRRTGLELTAGRVVRRHLGVGVFRLCPPLLEEHGRQHSAHEAAETPRRAVFYWLPVVYAVVHSIAFTSIVQRSSPSTSLSVASLTWNGL